MSTEQPPENSSEIPSGNLPERVNELDEIRAQILAETAEIAWTELARHFAAGDTLAVDSDLDLIEVALQLHQDNAVQLAEWLSEGLVAPVSDELAQRWFSDETLVWTCVVKPWVLVQERVGS